MPLPVKTAAQIEHAMAEFDAQHRGKGEWKHWEDDKRHHYAISHNGKFYPVKKIVSLATDIPRSKFTGGVASWDANPYVEQLGFPIVQLRKSQADALPGDDARTTQKQRLNVPQVLKAQWLEAFAQLGDQAEDPATDLKSPQITYKGWRFGPEHLRGFRSIVIRNIAGVGLGKYPPEWIECPPSDRAKNWHYRIEMTPQEFPVLIQKLDLINLMSSNSVQSVEGEFNRQVTVSLAESQAARLERLRHAPKIPEKVTVSTTAFIRNPYVAAEVLFRSAGNCEECRQAAPFQKRSDGTPYLEVHHRRRLADGGEDTVENAIALCPNCHRRFHYG